MFPSTLSPHGEATTIPLLATDSLIGPSDVTTTYTQFYELGILPFHDFIFLWFQFHMYDRRRAVSDDMTWVWVCGGTLFAQNSLIPHEPGSHDDWAGFQRSEFWASRIRSENVIMNEWVNVMVDVGPVHSFSTFRSHLVQAG